MSRPWSKVLRSLEATSGQRNCWAIPFPRECRILQVRIYQHGGTLGEFELRMFSRAEVCADGSQSSGGGDPAGVYLAEPDAYMVDLPHLSDGDGHLFLDYDAGQGYANMDGTGPCSRKYFIYFQINPLAGPGGELRTYDVAVTAEVRVGH